MIDALCLLSIWLVPGGRELAAAKLCSTPSAFAQALSDAWPSRNARHLHTDLRQPFATPYPQLEVQENEARVQQDEIKFVLQRLTPTSAPCLSDGACEDLQVLQAGLRSFSVPSIEQARGPCHAARRS